MPDFEVMQFSTYVEPSTPGPAQQQQHAMASNNAPGQTYIYHHPTSESVPGNPNMNLDEDWTQLSDAAVRRKLQNRIAQRNYRKKNLKKRLEQLQYQNGIDVGSNSNAESTNAGGGSTAPNPTQTPNIEEDQQPQQKSVPGPSTTQPEYITPPKQTCPLPPTIMWKPPLLPGSGAFDSAYMVESQNYSAQQNYTTQCEPNSQSEQQTPKQNIILDPEPLSEYHHHHLDPAQYRGSDVDPMHTDSRLVTPPPSDKRLDSCPSCEPTPKSFASPPQYMCGTPRSQVALRSESSFPFSDYLNESCFSNTNSIKSSRTPSTSHLTLAASPTITGESDGPGPLRMTALHNAAFYGHEMIVRLLLSKGADPRAVNASGKTTLHLAAEKGQKEVVQLLLDHGMDVCSRDGMDRTPLHYAAENGSDSIVAMLLARGCDTDAKDVSGQTALHRATDSGHHTVVRILLDTDTDFDLPDNSGQTALHRAAENGFKIIVWQLLEKGINIDAKDNTGQTALHRAAKWGQGDIVSLLIDTGADINAESIICC